MLKHKTMEFIASSPKNHGSSSSVILLDASLAHPSSTMQDVNKFSLINFNQFLLTFKIIVHYDTCDLSYLTSNIYIDLLLTVLL